MNIKLMLRAIFDPILLMQFFAFLITQFLGVGLYYLYLLKPRGPVIENNPILSEPQYFLLAFILLSLLFYLLITKIKGSAIVKGIFYLAMLEGVFLFFNSYFEIITSLIIAIVLLVIYVRLQLVIIHNFILLLTLPALGMVLGSQFTLTSAVVIMIVLMIYDFISVKKTEHMVSMFKGLVEKKVYFGMLFPFNFKNYFADLRTIDLSDGYFFLGTGDLALPLIIAVNVLPYGILKTGIVVVCAGLSLVAIQIYYLAKNIRVPLPGLVPLTMGSMLGLILAFLMF